MIETAKHEGLETLPRVALEHHLLKPVSRDLHTFEARYPSTAGATVLRRLWDAFALADEQLADVLGRRVHPAAGRWLATWRSADEEA